MTDTSPARSLYYILPAAAPNADRVPLPVTRQEQSISISELQAALDAMHKVTQFRVGSVGIGIIQRSMQWLLKIPRSGASVFFGSSFDQVTNCMFIRVLVYRDGTS